MSEDPKIQNIEVLASTRLFLIESVDLHFPNGEARTFERLMGAGQGAVMVVPLIKNDQVLLIREFAAGMERYELGFVKGKIDNGEAPEAAARRGRLRRLIKMWISCCACSLRYCKQLANIILAISGGQQQRVAIARSLCMESRIMLFDEPTSALDPEMINEVLDVMVELADTGMTMVCVTHEMGFARKVADTMVFMDEGKIIEVAPPEKFFSNPDSDRCREFLEQILEH